MVAKARAPKPKTPSQCDTCIERGHCPIAPSGCRDQPDIAFVGEAPGEDEEREGEPFVGRSGKLLRQVINLAGLNPEKLYFNNAVMWRPPQNRNPTMTEVKACAPRLWSNLERVRPKLIVPLGNWGVNAILGKGSGITHRRGVYREIELGGRMVGVLPAFHPAGILRNPDNYIDLYEDICFAKRIVEGETPVVEPPYDRYVDIDTQVMFDALIRRLKSVQSVSLDLETTALDPDKGEILSCAFCWEPETAAILDWQTMVKGNPVNHTALKEAMEALPSVAHNGQFDMLWLAAYGIDPPYFMDTMLAHFAVDERQGSHGLKRLSISRYKAPEYDEDLKRFIKEERTRMGLPFPPPLQKKSAPRITINTMGDEEEVEGKTSSGRGGSSGSSRSSVEDRKEPLRLLLTDWAHDPIRKRIMAYNGADADYTQRLSVDLRKEMQEDNVESVHDDILMPAAEHFIYLEQSGMLVDVPYHDSLGEKWQAEVDDLERQLRAYPGAEGLNFNSSQQIKTFLFDTLGLNAMPAKGEFIQQEEILKEIQEIEDPEAQEYWRSSSAHVRSKIKPRSTSSYMLYWLAQQHDFPRLMVRHRLVSKKLGTYYHGYKNIMRAGNRIHPRYRLHGARTGRLSSTDPSIHGMPRLHEIKRLFIADPGYELLYSDYSQAEVRMLAHLSGDEGLIKAMSESDIHRATSMRLFSLTEEELDALDEEKIEFYRRSAKTIAFGIIYGISDRSLAPQLGVSVKESETYREMFLRMMPVARRYIMQQKRRGRMDQEVASIYGYKRRFNVILDRKHLGEVERQAVNMPIQNAVSVMTLLRNMALLAEIDSWCDPAKPALPWPHIHDGFMIQVPIEHMDHAIAIAPEILHDVGFQTDVRFAVELKRGFSWGELETAYKG